ncbi:HAD domain-containing protein [Xylanimonas ulmi]|uniref:Secreted protein n=1 Tax=Xylanimonas ulmi TaxID=228973 RepID=A0A4Q7M8H6_9MICO|nr:HAD domain-containing protein [Xylanibacterium ulmi]RZS62459.1 hypothetical protein EV386_2792 [Xylanibacterium ulmi]
MSAPILFLDIDGVVNAFPKSNARNRDEYVRYDVAVDEGDGAREVYPIHVRPTVIDFLNRVHADGLAQVRWLTTWGRHARTRFAPAVGLGDFPVAADPPPDGSGRRVWEPDWWKLAVIRAQAGDRFVFVDDELDAHSGAILAALPGEALLLRPFAASGLEDWQIARVEEFLRA